MRNLLVVLFMVWACSDAKPTNDDTLQRLQKLEQRVSQMENNIPTWRMDNTSENITISVSYLYLSFYLVES